MVEAETSRSRAPAGKGDVRMTIKKRVQIGWKERDLWQFFFKGDNIADHMCVWSVDFNTLLWTTPQSAEAFFSPLCTWLIQADYSWDSASHLIFKRLDKTHDTREKPSTFSDTKTHTWGENTWESSPHNLLIVIRTHRSSGICNSSHNMHLTSKIEIGTFSSLTTSAPPG